MVDSNAMKVNPSFLLVLALLGISPADADPVSDLAAQAEQGDVAAQFQLGDRYLKGDGVKADPQEALKWYVKAAEQGNIEAQMKLGGIYLTGKGVLRNSSEAAKWFLMAADRGNAPAQCQMARMHMTGAGVAKDDVEAYKWASLSAAQNDAAGKKVLAFLTARMTAEQIAFGRNQMREYLAIKKAEETLQLPAEPTELVEPAPTVLPE